jgi:hypothetical protein
VKTLLAAITAMLMATTARGQELPNYPIRSEADKMLYDSLATSWDNDSPTARQCALDRLDTKHIRKDYLNLMEAFNACLKAELEEQ